MFQVESQPVKDAQIVGWRMRARKLILFPNFASYYYSILFLKRLESEISCSSMSPLPLE